jgi:hypothetical protein
MESSEFVEFDPRISFFIDFSDMFIKAREFIWGVGSFGL